MNINFTSWQMAFNYNWVDATALKIAVKTDVNLFGEITPEEYKQITNIAYVS
ncbi:XkdX family protein [Clostridium sp. BJN0013]|uniref:XkdX family protein n=1 Tax=Clostridium sp. BJN0013 TaxID=3236840 RepID=UPI0034C5F8D4